MTFGQAPYQCEGTTRTGNRCRRGVAHPHDWCGCCKGPAPARPTVPGRPGHAPVAVQHLPGMAQGLPQRQHLLSVDEYCALHQGVSERGLDVMVPVVGTDLVHELHPGEVDDDALHFYSTERSLDLALALYDLPSWPVVVRTDPGRADSPGCVAQAAVMPRPGTYLDIDGTGEMEPDEDWERLGTELFNRLLAHPRWGDINLPIARQYALALANPDGDL